MTTPSDLLGLLLPTAFALILLVWATVSAWLVVRGLVTGHRRHVLEDARHALQEQLTSSGELDALAERLRALFHTLPANVVLRLVSTEPVAGGLAACTARAALARLGPDQVARIALTPCAPRHNWRRIAALRLLGDGEAGAVHLLARAAQDRDLEISGAALALLARTPDPLAGAVLIDALKEGRHPASRVATYLDRFPLPLAGALRPLLHHPDPGVRYWGATLLATEALEPQADIAIDLAALTADRSPLVRRAAVASLARIDRESASRAARLLLSDDVWYVRAHAARALAEAEGAAAAETIAPLLADREWWVRVAAKESLQQLGEETWPVLVPYLDHEDGFARNGAAEVLQNIGVLDSLIVLEAATSRPSPAKIEMLRKISAAGGTRMTEALLDRVDAVTRPRVRQLLQQIGLEPVGARS